MPKPRAIRAVDTPATELIAICRKCSKKIDGGFGPDGEHSLAKTLRNALDAGKGKRARLRIVETGCLDICPRHAVVVTQGQRPGQLLIVPAGTPVDVVADRLGIGLVEDVLAST
ncbi:MAG: hypothetical protein ACRYG4_21785 [Janthinobacterium lividum]